MISDLGKMLDPVADKLTQASVIGCLMVRFPELVVLFVIYVLKEVAMLSGGLIMLKGEKSKCRMQDGTENSQLQRCIRQWRFYLFSRLLGKIRSASG